VRVANIFVKRLLVHNPYWIESTNAYDEVHCQKEHQ
jgi:hypothetical protein